MYIQIPPRPGYLAGMDLIRDFACPLNHGMILNCFMCSYGHATECHYPLTCEEARCGNSSPAEPLIQIGGLQ